MRRLLLASVAAIVAVGSVVSVAVHANSNAQSKVFVCATPQANNLLQADYEALVWVEVGAIGKVGEVGTKTNLINYDTWNTAVIQKSKGLSDAGSPAIEVARLPFDAGQIIMRAAALANLNYAFKIVRNDPVVIGGTGTVIYNRGLVTGPVRPMGKNEDFDVEVYTLGLQQLEIVVAPGAGGVAPTMTVAPAITPTTAPSVAAATVLTCSTGTFTGDATITYAFQWFAGGVAISGANASTFTVTSAQLGKVITARVLATNASGSAVGYAAATLAVVA